jgi:Zn-finger in ubiquitin-hydrolases and other protein
MCLICGIIGCFNVQAFQNHSANSSASDPSQIENEQENAIVLQGQGHSLCHFSESKHAYAMEIET